MRAVLVAGLLLVAIGLSWIIIGRPVTGWVGGLIGIALFMGGETTPSRAIVQSGGHAYRLIAQRLKDEFHRNGELQLLLLRYTQP